MKETEKGTLLNQHQEFKSQLKQQVENEKTLKVRAQK